VHLRAVATAHGLLCLYSSVIACAAWKPGRGGGLPAQPRAKSNLLFLHDSPGDPPVALSTPVLPFSARGGAENHFYFTENQFLRAQGQLRQKQVTSERLAERETLLYRLGFKLNRTVLNSCGNPIIRSANNMTFPQPGFFLRTEPCRAAQ